MRSRRAVGDTAACCSTPSSPGYWDSTASAWRPRAWPPRRMDAAAETFLADCRHRKLDVEDEATGRRRAAVLRRARVDERACTR